VLAITSGGQISCNGSVLGGSFVIELYYIGNTAYQENSALAWWGPITASSTGASVADPRPTITGITLSASTFTGGAASGTTVGTITVQTSGLGGSFAGTLSLTGTNAASFQIVGSTLETSGVVANGSYSINIVATQSIMIGSPFTQAETITGSSGGLTAPAVAAANGFNTLVFNADFLSTTDVATTAGQSTGAKLYWAPSGLTPSFTINTGAGSGVTAGATGVLTMNGWTGTSFGPILTSTPPGSTNTVTTGVWQHGYWEARMQFGATVAGSGAPGGIHEPAFWLDDVRNLTAGTYHFAETDIMEYFPNGTAGSTANAINTMHNWFDNGGSYSDAFNTNTSNFDSSHQPNDGAWHTYGMLWTGNGTTGQVSFYYDGILTTHQGGKQFYALDINGSPTATFTAMENTKMIIEMTCAGSGWPVNFDFVRVWIGP
jgi:hypothetical protein